MRIGDISSSFNSGEFVLQRDGQNLRIRLRPLTPKWDIERARMLPPPQAPREFARDKDGGLLRGKDGKPQYVANEDDPAYRRDAAAHIALVMMANIYYASIEEPDGLTWSADKSLLERDPRAFFRALLQEVSEFGMSTGEVLSWHMAVARLSAVTELDIEEAKSSFRDGGGRDDDAL